MRQALADASTSVEKERAISEQKLKDYKKKCEDGVLEYQSTLSVVSHQVFEMQLAMGFEQLHRLLMKHYLKQKYYAFGIWKLLTQEHQFRGANLLLEKNVKQMHRELSAKDLEINQYKEKTAKYEQENENYEHQLNDMQEKVSHGQKSIEKIHNL